MKNGGKKQNEALFVAFYEMRAVMFVLPDEITYMSIAGFYFLLTIRGLTGQMISMANLVYIEKNIKFEQESQICCSSTKYEESSRSSLIWAPPTTYHRDRRRSYSVL